VDLNHLYFDHQILLMEADGAPSGETQKRLEARASEIVRQIVRTQRALGAGAARAWEALAALGVASHLRALAA
jgi:hypothetical protein